MIQDIYPSRLDNGFVGYKLNADDYLFFFDNTGRVLLGKEGDEIIFTRGNDAKDNNVIYLFSIDDKHYFLSHSDSGCEKQGFSYYPISKVRSMLSGKEVFAVFTAYHLWSWYSDNVYCGKCGKKLVPYENERALRCTECSNVVYPRINPAVIVGVINGDSLLITRYRKGYAHNALIAGFTEIGETLEQTVAREVMEETGINVKNIRYYKSQPWGMAQDILVGYYCDVDGDTDISMDENELKYAEWVKRADIELQPNNLSLTNEMMRVFKEHRI